MEWHYLDALHEQHGPVNDAQLRSIVQTSGDCLVWVNDRSGWIPASELFSDSSEPQHQVTLDSHGQPVNPRFNRMRRIDRSLSETLGVVKGMIIDGTVTDAEAKGLHAWFDTNQEVVNVWPASAIYSRLKRILADGKIDPVEKMELEALFVKTVGDLPAGPSGNKATRLPLSDPPPDLVFPGKQFVFTGKFVAGTRDFCEQLVVARGASCSSKVVRLTDYLVIGNLGSKDWIQTSHGRKIERAVELTQQGARIRILAEEHWGSFLS